MQGSEKDTLQYAEQLLQQGKKLEARQVLATYIRRTPDSVQAWWLLSQVVVEEKQQVDCLERVLRLDPGHAPAQFRLERLKRSQERSASPVPPAPVEQELPPPAAQEMRPPARKKKAGILKIALIAVVLGAGTVAFGYVGMLVLGQKMVMDTQATQVMAQAWTRNPPMTLPPTWTPTATATPLPSKTPKPTNTPTPRPRIIGPAVGLYAPDFSLRHVVSGAQVSLSGYEGRPILLVFWTTWCPYCEQEMPALNSIYRAYRGDGFVLLGINSGESDSKVRSYRDEHNLAFPVLLDPNRAVTRRYQVSSYPCHFFIDTAGQIRYAASGMMEEAELDEIVKFLMEARGTQ